MKKIFFILVAALLVSSNAFAGKGYTNDTAPATCVDGDFWIDTNGTSTERFHICEEGTWVKHLGNGTTSNPSFLSVHASGGNLAAANKQVTKAWQTGLSYTTDVTSVIHGGQHYICTSNHTAGASTEPGVGASWATVWKVDSGGGVESYSDVVSVFGSGSCSGYLKSDGTCSTPSVGTADSLTAQYIDWSASSGGASIANKPTLGTAAQYNVGTGANNIVQFNSSGQLPFTIDVSDLTDTDGLFTAKANASCFASESAFNACFDLTWASGGISHATSDGNYYASRNGAWTNLSGVYQPADGDLTTAAGAGTAGNSKYFGTNSGGTVGFYDVPSGSGTVTVQADDPTSASAVGWYAATGSGDIFYKSSAGLFTIAGSYVADHVTPTLSSRVIGNNGTTLTLTGSASLSVGAGGSGGVDVDCVAAGSNIPATYANGAPGTDLVYTLGTTVNSGDTCDLDYTQPGNGIEATTGGADLASITSGEITNNSTQSSSTYDWTNITYFANFEGGTATGTYSLVTTACGSECEYSENSTTFTLGGSSSVAGSNPYYLSTANGVDGYGTIPIATNSTPLSGTVGSIGVVFRSSSGTLEQQIAVVENTTGNFHRIEARKNANGWAMRIYNGSNHDYQYNATINSNTDYRVAISYNYTTDQYKMYVNGTEIISVTDTYTGFTAERIRLNATGAFIYANNQFASVVVSDTAMDLSGHLQALGYGE